MRHGIQKTVSTEYDGSTLYHFLREGMGLAKKEISRAKFLEDGICVDGERQKVTAQVRKGQQVTVQTEKPDAVSGHLKASNAPLEILYEDMDVVVVNKPSGIPVHPSGRRTFEADTLANRLVHYLREKGEEGVIRIRRPPGQGHFRCGAGGEKSHNGGPAGTAAGAGKAS